MREGAVSTTFASAPKKAVLLRLDPNLYATLVRWAADDFRSTSAQIEYLLHKAVVDSGRGRAAQVRRSQSRLRRA